MQQYQPRVADAYHYKNDFDNQPLMAYGSGPNIQQFYNQHNAINHGRAHVEMQAPLVYVAQSSIKNDSPDSTPGATPPHLIGDRGL
jgi:hypothetical protein